MSTPPGPAELLNRTPIIDDYSGQGNIGSDLSRIIRYLDPKDSDYLLLDPQLEVACTRAAVAAKQYPYLDSETRDTIQKIIELTSGPTLTPSEHDEPEMVEKIRGVFCNIEKKERQPGLRMLSIQDEEVKRLNEELKLWVWIRNLPYLNRGQQNASPIIINLDSPPQKREEGFVPPSSTPIPIKRRTPILHESWLGFYCLRGEEDKDPITEEYLKNRESEENMIQKIGESWIRDYGPEVIKWFCNELRALLEDPKWTAIISNRILATLSPSADTITPVGILAERMNRKCSPVIVEGVKKVLIENLQDPEQGKILTENILHAAIPYCFYEPSNVDDFNKKVLLGACNGFKIFLKDYNTAIAENSEEKILASMIRSLQTRGQHPFVMLNGSPEEQLENFSQYILRFIHIIWHENTNTFDWDDLFAELVSVYIAKVLDQLFNPYAAAIVIQRLREESFDFENPYDKGPSRHVFSAEDRLFSESLSGLMQEIGHEVIRLGVATKTFKKIVKIFDSLFQKSMLVAADEVQRGLNKVLNTPSSLLGTLLVMNRFLYKSQGPKETPALLEYLQKTPEERKAFEERVCKQLPENPYKNLNELIKKQFNSLAKFAIEQVISLPEFCNTLTKKGSQIIMDEKMLKILLFYLLEGIKMELKEEDNGPCQVK